MSAVLSSAEQSLLSYITTAPHLPDMPAEFWHALAILRARGIVEFKFGHWVPNPELWQPSSQMDQASRCEAATDQ